MRQIMNAKQRRARKLTLLASLLASGGTLFTTCESRWRDAAVDASKIAFFQFFDALTPDADDILGDPGRQFGGGI